MHISSETAALEAAIAEYEAFARDHPDDELSDELLDVADDCREELEVRAARAAVMP